MPLPRRGLGAIVRRSDFSAFHPRTLAAFSSTVGHQSEQDHSALRSRIRTGMWLLPVVSRADRITCRME